MDLANHVFSATYCAAEAGANSGLAQDCETLLVVKDTLAGDAHLNWNPDIPVSSWDGLRLSYPPPSRVHQINLSHFGLNGDIPSALGQLMHLESLILDGNRLTGEVPPELAELPNLMFVDLSGNKLTGCVPGSQDEVIWAADIDFCSPVAAAAPAPTQPPYLEYDVKVLMIAVATAGGTRWQFSYPEIPGSNRSYDEVFLPTYSTISLGIGSTDAEYHGVSLPGVYDKGPWPVTGESYLYVNPGGEETVIGQDESGNQIKAFVVPQNEFLESVITTPAFPPKSKVEVPESYCPTEANTNPGLTNDCETLLAVRDTLAGDIHLNWNTDLPISDWDGVILEGFPPRVSILELFSLELNGILPSGLSNLSNLRWLNLWDNQLTGDIPRELGNLASLRMLQLGNNQLTGLIPPELGDLENLRGLFLDRNQLIGFIPSELTRLNQLRRFTLHENQLGGEVPGFRGLASLSLQGNKFRGCIPNTLVGVTESDMAFCGDAMATPTARAQPTTVAAPAPTALPVVPTPLPTVAAFPGPTASPASIPTSRVVILGETVNRREGGGTDWRFSYLDRSFLDIPGAARIRGGIFLPVNASVVLLLHSSDNKPHSMEAPPLFQKLEWPADVEVSVEFRTTGEQAVVGWDDAGNQVNFSVVDREYWSESDDGVLYRPDPHQVR